jgi:hypothetical protein
LAPYRIFHLSGWVGKSMASPSRSMSPHEQNTVDGALCYAVVLSAGKSGFRAGCRPEFSRETLIIGPPAGRRADFAGILNENLATRGRPHPDPPRPPRPGEVGWGSRGGGPGRRHPPRGQVLVNFYSQPYYTFLAALAKLRILLETNIWPTQPNHEPWKSTKRAQVSSAHRGRRTWGPGNVRIEVSLAQRDPGVVFRPSVFWEAWGTKANRTTSGPRETQTYRNTFRKRCLTFPGVSRPQGHLPRLVSGGIWVVFSTIRDPGNIPLCAVPVCVSLAPYRIFHLSGWVGKSMASPSRSMSPHEQNTVVTQ